MKVIKHIKSIGTKTKVKYPGIWPNTIVGLDPDIEYYEIQEIEEPAYNPEQFDLIELWNLTTSKGEVYNICEVSWQLIEKSQAEVLNNFNSAFGSFIDSVYPLWQRINDMSYQSEEGVTRKSQEAALRDERQQREYNYINNNIFPNFNFNWL